MARQNKKDNQRYGSSSGGSHLKLSGKRDVPYYEKNRSPMERMQARKTHKVGTAMFSQYDTSAIQPKKGKGGKIAAIVVVALVLLGLWFLLNNVFNVFGPPVKNDITPGVSVEVTIPEGAASKTIAEILYDADVVADQGAFLEVVNSKGAASALKPGTYSLTTLMDTDELVDALVRGPLFTGTKLTIPEGSTIEQTASYVEQATGIKTADFLALAKSASSYANDYPFLSGAYDDSMEGYLFPKTYDVQDGATADSVVRMMLDQFSMEIGNLGISTSGANGYTLAQLVNIASMIEKETSEASEMPTIASVICNRLDQGIRLQIDATVVYAMGDGYSGGAVTYDDLEIDSPYNTYKTSGLPAGPICSPGADALSAAANPADTGYLYYFSPSGTSTHQFFDSYDAFLAAQNG